MASHWSKLAVCLLNISEARNPAIVETIAKAACSVNTLVLDKNFKCSSTVLNIFSDHDYNRSVLTIAAPVANLQDCITNACKVAFEAIDLGKHCGGHPRLGAVDLVPVYPISPTVTIKECGSIARAIGEEVTRDIPGTSVFFFGVADQPRERGLVERRKEVGWYKGKHGICYDNVVFDMGMSPTSRYGLTGVGSSPYVMNCNVTIETDDIATGREIAKKIRGASLGGLPAVQAMSFKHEGCVEIACNVESYIRDTTEVSSSIGVGRGFKHFSNVVLFYKNQIQQSQTEEVFYKYTSPSEIRDRIKSLASENSIDIKETTVIGFTPKEVYKMAYKALSQGNTMAWKTIKHYRM